MTSKNLINADTVNTGSVNYKNRIINGDFQVNQRQKPVISNDSDYPVDRVFVDAINSEVVVTDEIVYSLNEGSLETETDPLGDGSGITLYEFEDDASGGAVTCTGDSSYNGQWKNDSGNNIDGIYDIGKFDNASSFDGSNTHMIQFPAPFKDNDIFTVSAWFKWNGTVGKYVIVEAGVLQIPGDINQNGNIRINYPNNGGNYGSVDVGDGNWHHIVVVHNINNQDNCYIDCTLDSQRDTASVDSSNNWYIGQYQNGTTGYEMDGLIDQVRIFNKALTEDEVRKLYVEDLNYINKKHLKVEVTSKDSNANINPYVYKFEGQDIKDIVDNDMTLSFEMLSSVTGDYTVKLVTDTLTGEQETFTKTITYDSSYNGDFGSFSITIPKSTFTKSLIDDERLGATLYIMNNADSNLNVGDVVRLTNVQLEVGSVATEFEVLPYDKQLERCMRYYEEFKNFYAVSAYRVSNNKFSSRIYFNTEKRVVPSSFIERNVGYDVYGDGSGARGDSIVLNSTKRLNTRLDVLNAALDEQAVGIYIKALKLDSEL